MRRKESEITNKNELMLILQEASTMRIAISTGKVPYIVPLNYGWEWNDSLYIYFHSAPEGRKITLLQSSPEIGVEIDCDHELITGDLACDWGMKFKSIIAEGIVHEIIDIEEKKLGLDCIMKQYSFQGETEYSLKLLHYTKVYRIDITKISGKAKK